MQNYNKKKNTNRLINELINYVMIFLELEVNDRDLIKNILKIINNQIILDFRQICIKRYVTFRF